MTGNSGPLLIHCELPQDLFRGSPDRPWDCNGRWPKVETPTWTACRHSHDDHL